MLYYLMIFKTTMVLSQFLLFSIINDSWYPQFYKVARIWSTMILFGMGTIPKIQKKQDYIYKDSLMFVANHRSMLDIMLMYYMVSTPFVFVGKKELAKIPIFGFSYKRTCILVDRNSMRSKSAVMKEATRRINNGLSVCIFPEGRIPDDTSIVLDRFKDGSFKLVLDHKILIAELVFNGNGKRFPYDIFNGDPGRLRVEMIPVIETKDTSIKNRLIILYYVCNIRF